MSNSNQQEITYEPNNIWDQQSCPPSSYGKSVNYFILGSCRNNYHDDVKKHFHLTKWTPFELMIITIHGLAYRQLHTFAFLLPKLQKEDATKTFLLPNGDEHTLLTLCACAAPNLLQARDALSALLELGCQWDQEVQGGKTALSFLVKSCDDTLIKWCVSKGANPQKGHLLVYASKLLTKSQYDERTEIEKNHRYLAMNGMTPLADPDMVHPPYNNQRTFTYLVSIGAPVDDVDPITGMTPLIGACCEDNLSKVQLLLQHGVPSTLYRKNNQGMDAFDWLELHMWKYEDRPDDIPDGEEVFVEIDYPLLDLVTTYKEEQRQYWKEVVGQVMEQASQLNQTMLQEVPVRDILEGII